MGLYIIVQNRADLQEGRVGSTMEAMEWLGVVCVGGDRATGYTLEVSFLVYTLLKLLLELRDHR